jgi:Tol biopolymer transport system component
VAAPAPSPFEGKIVLFGAQRVPPVSGVVEIIRMNTDGKGIESLLTLKQIALMTGRVSPDGQRLGFGTLSADGKTWETWVWDVDGKRRIVSRHGMMRAWSPDGKRIACFRSDGKGGWRSFLAHVEDDSVEHLTLPITDVVDDWSNGDSLSVLVGNPEHTFEHPGKGTYPLRQLALMAIDGSQMRPITTDPSLDNIWSRFSPDGTRIAHYQRWHRDDKVLEGFVVREKDGKGSVVVLRSDRLDEELREIPTDPPYPPYWSASNAPCWSPDGSQLAVCLNNGKSRSRRREPLRFALVFLTTQGKIHHTLDLKKMCIAFVSALDWK